MSYVNIILKGKIVSRGKNLRAITDYARKTSGWPSAPAVLSFSDTPDGIFLNVMFANGATARTQFQSRTALDCYIINKCNPVAGRVRRFCDPHDAERYVYPTSESN